MPGESRREVVLTSPLIDELAEREQEIFIRTLNESFGVHAVVRAVKENGEQQETTSPKWPTSINLETFIFLGKILGHHQKGVDDAANGLRSMGITYFLGRLYGRNAEEIEELVRQGGEAYTSKNGVFTVLQVIQLPDGETAKLFNIVDGEFMVDLEALQKIIDSGYKYLGVGRVSLELYQKIIDHYRNLAARAAKASSPAEL